MIFRMRLHGIPALLCVVLAAALFSLQGCGAEKPNFSVEYQAVFMDNGQVFFGKMERAGSPYPLLREVYYIGEAGVTRRKGSEEHSHQAGQRVARSRIHVHQLQPHRGG